MRSSNRLYNIGLFFSFLFIVIAVNLLNLQIFRTRQYRTLAEDNCFKKETVIPVRGNIISSDHIVIATSKRYFSLYADIGKMDLSAENIFRLANIISISPESINCLVKYAKMYNEKEVCLKSNLDIQTVTFIEENGGIYQGLSIKSHPRRFYPFGGIYAHSIGYVGNISSDEYLKYKQKGYNIADFVGKTGIEKFYEKYIKGQNGIKYFETDAMGRVIREIEKKNAVEKKNGMDVYVSLNHSLQSSIDTFFAEFESGSAILINAKSGGVIALYSKPYFDPNIFVYGIRRDMWEYLRRNPLSPFLNRCSDGVYPPGSTFKIVTMLSGLNEHVVDSNTYFQECNGSILISNRVFNCWSVHGEMNLHNAFIHSCDVYFYQLGMKLGLDRIADYAYKCGFGDSLGIDIFEESNGLIPDAKYLNKKYGRNGWGIGQIANVSIGQGDMLVTPMQMTSLILAIVNSGKRIVPHLVDSIVDKNGETSFRFKTRADGTIPFSKDDLNTVQAYMIDVVNSIGGTGVNAKPNFGIMGGKTGTAENPAGEPHAWFTGFYTNEETQLVITVVIENGGHGGDRAAVIAKKIIDRYMETNFGNK